MEVIGGQKMFVGRLKPMLGRVGARFIEFRLLLLTAKRNNF